MLEARASGLPRATSCMIQVASMSGAGLKLAATCFGYRVEAIQHRIVLYRITGSMFEDFTGAWSIERTHGRHTNTRIRC